MHGNKKFLTEELRYRFGLGEGGYVGSDEGNVFGNVLYGAYPPWLPHKTPLPPNPTAQAHASICTVLPPKPPPFVHLLSLAWSPLCVGASIVSTMFAGVALDAADAAVLWLSSGGDQAMLDMCMGAPGADGKTHSTDPASACNTVRCIPLHGCVPLPSAMVVTDS